VTNDFRPYEIEPILSELPRHELSGKLNKGKTGQVSKLFILVFNFVE